MSAVFQLCQRRGKDGTHRSQDGYPSERGGKEGRSVEGMKGR